MADKHLTEGTLGAYDEDNAGAAAGGAGVYGTRQMAGTPADTVTRLLGDYIDSFPIPTEKPAWIDRTKFTSFDFGELKSGAKMVEFELPYLLLEGPSLLYALGRIAAAPTGGDNAYVHTITPIEPAHAIELPSRTFHIQIENSLTTSRYIDICGVITNAIDVGGDDKNAAVTVKEKFLGQRITDENATTDLDGVASAGSEDDAQDFTAAPAFYDSNLTYEDPYYLESIIMGGVNITKDIKSWNINTINEFVSRRANRTGTDNYGRTINNYVGAHYLKKRRYSVALNLLPTDETYPFWVKMQEGDVANNDLVISLTRTKSHDSIENTIVYTFDTSVCPITDISGMVNFALANEQAWAFLLRPKTLTNVVITDDIANYGDYEPNA
ncbi:MAG: hypothetical protein KAS32_21820 [Candidatus Peribacteraceae bacterium]|nr:hypothetical protein [Candidatus Peribacteraceae bacterium]